MKKKRYSVEQITAILKQVELGSSPAETELAIIAVDQIGNLENAFEKRSHHCCNSSWWVH